MVSSPLAIAVGGLVFARVLPVALLVPPVGDRRVPIHLRVAVALALAVPFCCSIGISDAVVVDLPTYLLWLARNLSVGLILGSGVAAILWAAQMAGSYLQIAAGWLTPSSDDAPIGNVMYLLVAVLFVLIDGHHGVLMALSESLEIIPLGPDAIGAAAQGALIGLPARMLLASLMIAAPALLAVLLALAMVAVAERLSTELGLAGISRSVAPLVALATLIAALPLTASVALWQMHMTVDYVLALLRQ
jgi:flagellar biosynthetic protein FliR